jgi:hypothetical protein
MGMGFTSSLALADNNPSASSPDRLSADDYKTCVEALKGVQDKPSDSPAPSASASATDSAEDAGDGKDDSGGKDGKGGKDSTPAPPATPTGAATGKAEDTGKADDAGSGTSSSSDSGSDDEATPPASATPTPPASHDKGGGLLGALGDTLGNVLTGGSSDSGARSTPSAAATPSTTAGKGVTETVKDTTEKVTGTVKDTVQDTTDTASEAVGDVTGTVKDTTKDVTEAAGDAVKGVTGTASALPGAGAGATTVPDGCPVATDAEGGIDNPVLLADDPWYLDASSLTLNGADYRGVVQVRTANGTVKKVLKYVVSNGTDIGDLHQTVRDKQSGKTYHVQAAKGSHSTITGGDTVMYTESISGNLLGLLPVTFSPDSPPPLNLPDFFFTHVHVVQAAQFGGNLYVPGMHVYTTD